MWGHPRPIVLTRMSTHIHTTSPRQHLIERYIWYGGVMALLLALRRQTEALLRALPRAVYPRLHLLQELSHHLRARTNSVVAAMVPSRLDVRRFLLEAQRHTRYGRGTAVFGYSGLNANARAWVGGSATVNTSRPNETIGNLHLPGWATWR